MKRADLETFLGKMVELKLFDGSVIRGCLRKTQDETFKGRKRHGASETAESLENYLFGLTCAIDVVEKYVDKEETE